MSHALRIGAVSYLNTKPLVYGLSDLVPEAQLKFDLPSRLAEQLSTGQLDVALIPAIEYFRHPEYTIVSDACIACRGPVMSVKLFFRRAPAEVRWLALDEGSRTSSVLAQILLQQRLGIDPRVVSLPIGQGLDDTDADAVLLIGDRAIHARDASCPEVWDLGDVWCRQSELPFVFAMWTSRPDVDVGELHLRLAGARDAGVAHLPTIAEQAAASVGLSLAASLAYLRDNLHFQLGPWERRGLQKFYDQASEMGLAPRGRGLTFYPSSGPLDCTDAPAERSPLDRVSTDP